MSLQCDGGVGWDPDVVKVAGSHPSSLMFGKSTQSLILPGVFGSLTPTCATIGPTAGKVCTVITQSNASSDPVVYAPGLVVIGNLLLEVVPGAQPGSSLGLSISGYRSNQLRDPALDPSLTIGSNFQNATLVNPEPATGALLALGLVGLGLSRRRIRAA